MWGDSHTRRERLAAAVPALCLGLAAGVLGGLFAGDALDTTPYGEVEFNTASRAALEKGRELGRQEAAEVAEQATSRLKESNAEQVTELTARLAKTRKALAAADERAADQKAEMATLQGSLAETTAALDNAASQARATGGGQNVEGTLKSTWTLGPGAKPWPTGCAEPLGTYQVRVTAATGATVADAELVGADVTRRGEKRNTLTLVCSLTYAAGLPTPLGGEYRFVVEAAESGRVVTQGQAPASALEDGAGPLLSVTR